MAIRVRDASDAVVSGVTVSASWDGGPVVTCVTNSTGTCSESRRFSNAIASTTFSIVGLSKSGMTYAPGSNGDPDGDSDGTSITVLKP